MNNDKVTQENVPDRAGTQNMAQDQPIIPEGEIVAVEANDVHLAELRSRLLELGFFNLAAQLGLNMTTTGSNSSSSPSANRPIALGPEIVADNEK
ncbi:unnamed protein product [Caenorhabditis angaria]|uniref:Uncharacterized protein n=1 Tax=Caenorhabditis angaria TaxID=860376 RepID=A0A9P1I4A0_9PELO|nr:unnamed protein product [Caenorhabditis angaria]